MWSNIRKLVDGMGLLLQNIYLKYDTSDLMKLLKVLTLYLQIPLSSYKAQGFGFLRKFRNRIKNLCFT